MWAQSELWAETGVQGQRPLPRLCMFMWLLPCFFACSLVRLYLLSGGMCVVMCLPVHLCVCVCLCACAWCALCLCHQARPVIFGPQNKHTYMMAIAGRVHFVSSVWLSAVACRPPRHAR